MNIKALLIILTVTSSSISAFAVTNSFRNECVDYLNSAFSNDTDSARLEKALLALNLVFDLKLTEKDLVKIETLVAQKKVSQDGLERMTYFGCTEEMTAADRQQVQEQFTTLLK